MHFMLVALRIPSTISMLFQSMCFRSLCCAFCQISFCHFQHVVDFSPNLYPHLLSIFLLFDRREILHSYGFEHMPLLYNLEKAGLVKRQVSQHSFSMNLVFFFSFRAFSCFSVVFYLVIYSSSFHINFL